MKCKRCVLYCSYFIYHQRGGYVHIRCQSRLQLASTLVVCVCGTTKPHVLVPAVDKQFGPDNSILDIRDIEPGNTT
jgi:hypothetical protein